MKYFKILYITLFFYTHIASNLYATEIKHIHFLIPGGNGGGWDKTARSVGKALTTSNLLKSASYENISGSSGGKALSYIIETAPTQKNTLMINSTPILIRSLQHLFSKSFKDLTLVSSIIADYQVLAVRTDSPLKNWSDILKTFQSNPRLLKVGGGSNRGGMDHLVSAEIFKAAGENPQNIYYLAYDAGGKALDALLKKEVDILSTGFGEVFQRHKKGDVRIIAVTSKEPIENAKNIPTFYSLGIDVVFANWRGFFAAPGIDKEKVKKIQNLLVQMLESPQWKEIQKRNGWINLYKTDKEFEKLLKDQENNIGIVIRDLGIL